MSRGVARIDRIVPRRSAEFGGKARGLSALVRAGFPVPPAFALSSRLAEHHFARILPDEDQPHPIFRDPDVGPERLAAIAARVRAEPLGEELLEDLRGIFAELRAQGAVGLSVRSSSTMEDAEGAGAPGMHDTVLNVTTEDALADAVRACWAALFARRAHVYARAHGELVPAMGVVVQAMVPAEAAGVIFTVNPLTGDAGEIVVDASYGLGVAVAGGKVSPDTYRLDKATRGYRDRIIGQKEVEVVADEAGGVLEREVPPERRAELCLRPLVLEELAELALRIERQFGGPQDIEFAVHRGDVWILQARPLSVVVQPGTKRWQRRKRSGATGRAKLVWSNVNVGEALPGVATPLTWSVLSHFSELGFRRAFGALGISLPQDAELVGGFRGRIYLNLTEILGALSQVPGFRPSMVLSLGGGGFEEVLDADVGDRKSAAFLARLPITLRRYATENYRLSARVRAFDAEFAIERRRLRSIDLRVLPPSSLAQTMKDTEHLLDRTGAIMLTVYGNLLGTSMLLSLALGAVAREQAAGLARDLLAGMEDIDSAEPGLALTRVAETLARDPAAARVIAERAPEDLTVEDLPEGPTRRALQHFLRAYGHRGPREAELAEPRWEEDPTTLFATLQIHQRRPGRTTVAESDARRQRVRADAERRLVAVVPFPMRPPIRALLAIVQRYTRMREHLRSHVTDVLGLMRRVALDASMRIAVREPAAGRDAAFFLTVDELHQVLRGELARVAPRIIQRRVQYERDRALPDPPDTFVGFPPALRPPPPDRDRLAGLAASAGVAQGPVRILRRAEDAKRFEPGEVLVASVADVGWSPLFLVASAVVTDLGGPLSHASIVLREYGVPAVVNVKDATSLLRDGEIVRVDGFQGEVRRLSPRAAEATVVAREPGE